MKKTYKIWFTKTENAPSPETISDGEIAVGMNQTKTRMYHKLTDGTIAEYIPLSEINKKLEELPFARYYTGTVPPPDYFGEDGSIYLQTID